MLFWNIKLGKYEKILSTTKIVTNIREGSEKIVGSRGIVVGSEEG